MNWLICGTIPEKNFPLSYNSWHLSKNGSELSLESEDGKILDIQRGTSALVASTLVAMNAHKKEDIPTQKVKALLVGDTGDGEGSRKLYKYLAEELLPNEYFNGISFHYLFPDVDWHNKVLISCEAQEESFGKKPLLLADAGFMYVAKMSGYADSYDIFTPDIGEMAFLADENAPHPFYTRGFLLAKEDDIFDLLERAKNHKMIAKNLIIKGSTDYIVTNGEIVSTVNTPSIPTMEAIGGTGDLVTGLLTAYLMQEQSIVEAMKNATKEARNIGSRANPTPATQISQLLNFL